MRMHLIGVFIEPEGRSWEYLATSMRRLPKVAFVAGLVAALASLSALFAAPASADAAKPSFLHSVETRSTNLGQFTRWIAVLSRSAEEASHVERTGCRFTDTAACNYKEWLQFLHSLRGTSRWEQLVAVNTYMNARTYVPDDKNWGIQDHWATPGEFLARSGDCEDFAIAKFLSLKQLGWTDDELRIAAVKDRKLGVGHAVVVAYFGGRTWLLDNQLKHVTDLETIRHYEPVYSINESHWWLHKKNDRPEGLVLTVGSRSAR